MNIVTSAYTLDLSGVPTFTLTMYRELTRRGHKVTVYSPLGGKLESEMNVVKNLNGILRPDVIVAQHAPCAIELKKTFPNVPLFFYSHGLLPVFEQPPDIRVTHYLAINEEVENNLVKKGIPKDHITIVRDFVDTDRFKPVKPINKNLTNVLFISNYKKWKNFKTVYAACEKLGVKLTCFGSPYGRNYKIEEAINEADMIISWGRGILEAMSSGRAALSFDRFEGDGYITPETYFEARKNNFSGRVYKYNFNRDTLYSEMLKYNPSCSKVNRDLVLKYHNAVSGVDQILEAIKKYGRR